MDDMDNDMNDGMKAKGVSVLSWLVDGEVLIDDNMTIEGLSELTLNQFKKLLESYAEACSFHHGRDAVNLQQQIVGEYSGIRTRALTRIAELEKRLAEIDTEIREAAIREEWGDE